jgi:hypothetical protein
MKSNTFKYVFIFLVSLVVFGTSITAINLNPKRSGALSGSEFNPSRIIDDIVFYNSNSMSIAQIQQFLNSKVPVCDTNGVQPYAGTTRAAYSASRGYPAPYTCLKNYSQVIPTITNSGSDLCKGSIVGGNKSAANIIYDVSKACGINPQVLIVMLQKEMSLITDDWPWTSQYDKAMGYACPDSGPNNSANCDSAYFGFFNQVYNAAKAYRRYEANPNSYNYRAGRNNYILYNPNTACGGTNVFIENQATASLYIYTPYQPNASALSNLYGTGDSCGAYGNRNFWRMFRDWFGPTYSNDTYSAHPNGTLIALNGKVYKIEASKLRHITHPDILFSYRYTWSDVRKPTTGDKTLPIGLPMNRLAPGTVYRTNGSPVYVVEYENDELTRQHISYASFVSLGYDWSKVLLTTPAITPAVTHSKILTQTAHPSGSLVLDNQANKVYLIENGIKRHVLNPVAFDSQKYKWSEIKNITSIDKSLPVGPPLDIRTGSYLLSSGLYVVDEDQNGSFKRPLGPWECFADRLSYTSKNWIPTPSGLLPKRTGATYSC